MEEVYFGIAVSAFILAACSFVACIAIFFGLHVLDAIRFLRHKSARRSGGSAVRAHSAGKREERKDKKPARASVNAGDSVKIAKAEHSSADKAVMGLDGCHIGEVSLQEGAASSTSDEVSECPTGPLNDNDSEASTAVLSSEASECPTVSLEDGCDNAECVTDILLSIPDEVDDGDVQSATVEDGDSECSRRFSTIDLSRSSEESERPTGVLVSRAETEKFEQEDSTFHFIVRQDIVGIHTDEVIE